MKNLQVNTNPKVEEVFNNYPEIVQEKIYHIRRLILEAASELGSITQLEETLKWGEPSYLTKIGSTIRMDWKKKAPNQYAIYFQCTSKLIPAFRMLYKDLFQFEGNRAIIFQMDDKLPDDELKDCIKAGLTYHKVKHLPMLGLG